MGIITQHVWSDRRTIQTGYLVVVYTGYGRPITVCDICCHALRW
jgi:hypothetical protein